jgi:hypothetical protein
MRDKIPCKRSPALGNVASIFVLRTSGHVNRWDINDHTSIVLEGELFEEFPCGAVTQAWEEIVRIESFVNERITPVT